MHTALLSAQDFIEIGSIEASLFILLNLFGFKIMRPGFSSFRIYGWDSELHILPHILFSYVVLAQVCHPCNILRR